MPSYFVCNYIVKIKVLSYNESSTIDKMFKISYFRTKCKYKFPTYFRKTVPFTKKMQISVLFSKKNANFGSIFEKSVHFEHFVNGGWSH